MSGKIHTMLCMKCPTCDINLTKAHRCFGMRWRGDETLEPVYHYWRGKVRNEKSRGVRFLITGPELVALMEEGGITAADLREDMVLGRLDHDKDYTLDNVEWQTRADNSRVQRPSTKQSEAWARRTPEEKAAMLQKTWAKRREKYGRSGTRQ